MSNLQELIAQALGTVLWNNNARLLHLVLPDGSANLVESFIGSESMLGMPLPVAEGVKAPDIPVYGNLAPCTLTPLHSNGYMPADTFAGFDFTITFLCDNGDIDISALVHQPALLLMQLANGEKRPFHGIITSASLKCWNNGFARYAIVVRPWLALLDHEKMPRTFQQKNISSILDEVFYPIGSHFNYSVNMSEACRSQSTLPIITQVGRESSLCFVHRLLKRGGMLAWFSHSEESHVLNIELASDLFAKQGQGVYSPISLRFHRKDATEKDDTVQVFSEYRSIPAQEASFNLYDPRHALPQQTQTKPSTAPVGQHKPNPSHFELSVAQHKDQAGREQLADEWQAGQNCIANISSLRGSVRHLAPLGFFHLTDHMRTASSTLLAPISVSHHAWNNINADLHEPLKEALRDFFIKKNAPKPQEAKYSEDFFYENSALVVPVRSEDGSHTARLIAYAMFKEPIATTTLTGLQTAIVVPDANGLIVDRHNRVHVQFHWQRGRAGHQQPYADSSTDDTSTGQWVPLGAQFTGNHMGSVFVPRVGQEVLVDFIQGNIDQPMIVGVLYNGSGQTDAVGSSTQPIIDHMTANTPVFHVDGGSNGSAVHDDVLYGIKTQSMPKSQQGDASKGDNTSGYNTLTFDHSAAAARIEISTTAYASQLQLGTLRHQNDNVQREIRGKGFALETQGAGQIRGSQGLLISSHGTAQDAFMQSQAAGHLQEADQAQQAMQSIADTHKAVA